ncbi:MAG: PepSY domain-containing protein [Hyphomicrobium sp.]
MPKRHLYRRSTFIAALLAVLAIGLAHADDVGPEAAKRLLSEGRIKPLAEVLDAVKRQVPGEMLEVELELEETGYVYELKLLRPDGKVQEIEADAASGKILKIEDDD